MSLRGERKEADEGEEEQAEKEEEEEQQKEEEEEEEKEEWVEVEDCMRRYFRCISLSTNQNLFSMNVVTIALGAWVSIAAAGLPS